MADWKHCTIGALCDAGVAELQTGPFGTQLHAHDYRRDGIPVVPTEAIRNRQIDHSVLPKISPAKAEELVRHKLRIGDILFARRGIQAAGHIGYVRDGEEGFICGTGAIRLRLNAGNSEITPDFLSHVLANSASIRWFKSHAIGATMPNLNERIIRAFSFLVPTISEQFTISSILGALDDKIELNRRMNETLEAIIRAHFKSWFVDFDPVRAKAAGREPSLANPIADLFPDVFETSELGEIPKGWRVSQIAELARIVGGSTPSTKQVSFWNDGRHYWATPKDLSALSTPVLLGTERSITDQGLAQIGSGLLPPGTVLLSSRAPIGYLAVSEVPVAINQGFIAMLPAKGIPKLFLLYWAEWAHEAIVSRANGSTFLEISKASFRSIPVVTPPNPVLGAFAQVIQPVYDRIVTNEKESHTLAALRDTLLPKLISGELRVKQAERVLAEAV